MSCNSVYPAPECITGAWYYDRIGKSYTEPCTDDEWVGTCWCPWDTTYISDGRYSECPSVAPPTPQPTTPKPTPNPTSKPTLNPSPNPTLNPSPNPSPNPTLNPSVSPTFNPSSDPSSSPTSNPSTNPSLRPTYAEGAIIEDISTSVICTDCHDIDINISTDQTSGYDNSIWFLYLGIPVVLIGILCVVLCVLCILLRRKQRKRKKSAVIQQHIHSNIHANSVQPIYASSSFQPGERNAEEMNRIRSVGSASSAIIGECELADVAAHVNPIFPSVVPEPVFNPAFHLPAQPQVSKAVDTMSGPVAQGYIGGNNDLEYTDKCVDCGSIKKGKQYESMFYCVACYNNYDENNREDDEQHITMT